MKTSQENDLFSIEEKEEITPPAPSDEKTVEVPTFSDEGRPEAPAPANYPPNYGATSVAPYQDPNYLMQNAQIEKRKTYGSGSIVSGFIFFSFTVTVFVLYVIFSISVLYAPLLDSPENLGEAIASIFGYLIGLIVTFGFAIAQLPENIVSIILFQRLRTRAEKKGSKVLYTVFFALSICMLALTVLSLLIFLVTALLN